MIYNLFLNSSTDVPLTNYFSAETTLNRGQRIYAVDWSFLPENKKYKVTFRFNTLGGSFTSNNLLFITTNFGPLSSSVSAGSITSRQNNSILGVLKVRQGTTATTDLCLVSFPKENEPVFLYNRPTNNFLEIRLISVIPTVPPTPFHNLATDYVMILSFEECE